MCGGRAGVTLDAGTPMRGGAMSTTDMQAAARALFDHANRGEYDAFDALLDPDYVIHSGSEDHHGSAGLADMVRGYREVLADMRVTVDDQFGSGDQVATRFTIRGRHEGELMGAAPTGREVTFTGICISRFRDGRIVEEWEQADVLALLQQVGAVPQPA
jgi:predicted ester cyclase